MLLVPSKLLPWNLALLWPEANERFPKATETAEVSTSNVPTNGMALVMLVLPLDWLRTVGVASSAMYCLDQL
jgi:hypothetical protein